MDLSMSQRLEEVSNCELGPKSLISLRFGVEEGVELAFGIKDSLLPMPIW